MLRPEVDRLSDVDLGVEIVPKERNWERLEQENRERVEELACAGRTFRNFLEIQYYWHHETFRFLKGRSRVVALADYTAEKSFILRVPHRVLLGEDEEPPRATPKSKPPQKQTRRPRDCPF